MGIKDYRKCHLIVDSNCELPKEIVDTLDLEVLQFPYILEGVEYLDDFWQSNTPENFYQGMKDGKRPTTAAYPLSKFIESFTRAAQAKLPTVYLSFPAALSGSYNSALLAADQVRAEYPDFELHIVDNCSPSVGAAQLVLQAARMRDRGMSASELADWAEESKNYIHGYFTLESLDALAAGGRLPATAAQIGTKLDIKAMLSYDLTGSLVLGGVTRGRKRALKGLVEKFKQEFNGDMSMPLVLGSTACQKDAEFVAELIKKDKNYQQLPVIYCAIGPVVGSHVGPGMVALSFWGKDRRESSSVVDRIAERVRKADK